jgi:hypothetical protein
MFKKAAAVFVSMWMSFAIGCMPNGMDDFKGVPLPAKPAPKTTVGVPPTHPEKAGTPPANPSNKAEPDNLCENGPNKVLPKVSKVYYGTTKPQYLPLTDNQILAIGKFWNCSGLLIKPRWVLSASHCGLSAGTEFCMGKNPSNPNVCIKSVAVYDNPYDDMSLIELAQDAQVVFPDVEPVPLLTDDLDASWIGKTAEAAGYGQQETGYGGEREFTAEPIAYLGSSTLTINGEGKHGVCFGDSGGPVMVIASDGSVRVAGNLSNGDSSCVGFDNYTRVDVYRNWLESHTGPTVPPGPQPCGIVDHTGHCNSDGTRATYCGTDASLQSDPCPSDNVCSWSTQAAGWRCVPKSQDVCGGTTHWGQCNGNVLTWCGEGGLLTRDCGACGETCVPDDQFGFHCVVSDCGDVTFHGQCTGTTATWCSRDGHLETKDCAAHSQGCGWLDDESGNYCVDHFCGDINYHGICQGNVATWCNGNGTIQTKDCAAEGKQCGWVDNEKGNHCVTQPCGDVDYFGQCNGDVALWCDQGELKSNDCATSNQACGVVDDQTGNHCLSQACGTVDFHGACNGNVVTWCNRNGAIESMDCAEYSQNCDLLSPTLGYYCVD